MSCSFCPTIIAEKPPKDATVPWCGDCEADFINRTCKPVVDKPVQVDKPKDTLKASVYDCGKYPFLKDSARYMANFGVEVFGKSENNRIITNAVTRMKLALDGGYDTLVFGNGANDELLTFVCELLILRSIGINKLYNKWALSEARRVEYFLERDDQRLVFAILAAEFGVRIIKIEKEVRRKRKELDIITIYKITVPDYLKLADQFHEPEWKLENRRVNAGYVYLDDIHDIIRLVRYEVQKMLLERIAKVTVPKLPEMLSLAIDYLKNEYQAHFNRSFVPLGAIPPCIDKITTMLSKGENVSHQGRILLATYMAGIGKDEDSIIDMFRHAPDFNEKITRTQVGFLVNNKRLGRSYNVSNCDKVKSNSLCYPDQFCETITNPMQYKRIRK